MIVMLVIQVIQAMLTVRLDPETEQQLTEILAHEKDTNRSDLVKRLIKQQWLALNLSIPFVERRGGHPQHLLTDAPPNLSERARRKQAIADHLKQRNS
jgi:hypothetical protein